MKKFIFIAATLIFLSQGVYAAWVSIAHKIGDKQTQFYVDMAKSRGSPSSIVIAHLLDHSEAQANAYGKQFLSQQQQVEYDCAGKRARGLTLTQYSGNMGEGEVVGAYEKGSAWVPFSSGGVAQITEQMICKRD